MMCVKNCFSFFLFRFFFPLRQRALHLPSFCIHFQARFPDERGYFQELFHCRKYPDSVQFERNAIPQVSISSSRRGVLRGLHCSEYPKLVTVVHGAVYDVIVDLRKHSSTFRRWCAVVVGCENQRQLFIPAGCGHGFCGCTCHVGLRPQQYRAPSAALLATAPSAPGSPLA